MTPRDAELPAEGSPQPALSRSGRPKGTAQIPWTTAVCRQISVWRLRLIVRGETPPCRPRPQCDRRRATKRARLFSARHLVNLHKHFALLALPDTAVRPAIASSASNLRGPPSALR